MMVAILCLTPPPQPELLDAKALSLGISSYSPWDLEMANMGYKVIQYDASIDKSPYNHPNITFVKKFVGVSDTFDTISFEKVIKDNNLKEDSHNVLQVDIEDCEWDILDNINLSLIFKYFHQIIFEFHNCNPEDEIATQKRLPILEKIKKYYTPIHAHFNNNGNIFYSNGLFLSDVFEVSYIRNNLIPENIKYKVGNGALIGLDSPNTKIYPDIPIIFKNF